MRAQFCCNLTVNSDQFEANVTDLQPETAYIFSVGYTSRGFRSDLSEEQVLMTTDSKSHEYLLCCMHTVEMNTIENKVGVLFRMVLFRMVLFK